MNTIESKIAKLNWNEIAGHLDGRGYALTEPLLAASDCDRLIRLYADRGAFRSRVVMQRHNFGRGEYQYFADPLPQLVVELREHFYAPLAAIANGWADRLKQPESFPE